jgi:hypothetical protein
MLKTCLLLEEIKKGVERRATIVTAALSWKKERRNKERSKERKKLLKERKKRNCYNMNVMLRKSYERG